MNLRLSCRLTVFLLTVLSLFLSHTALGQAYPLDRVGLTAATPAAPAYSLRLLSSGYPGKAVSVRRDTDNSTQDIGFTAAGDLDTAALQAFVGSGSGYVTRWYDQSGFAVDAFQATGDQQPRLVNAGVIERLNGRPAIYLGTASLATAPVVLFPTAVSMIGVARGTSPTPGALVTKTGTSAGANSNFPSPFDFSNSAGDFHVGNASTANLLSTISLNGTNPRSSVSNHLLGSVHSFVVTGIGGMMSNYLNGTAAGSTSVSDYEDGGAPLHIGNRNDGGSTGNFWTPELVLFNFALSTSDRTLVENAQKTYYGPIPCPELTISAQPLSDTLCLGATATLFVVATGGSDYQWLHDGVPVGGNSATLSIPGFSAADAGTYTCRVISACSELTSAPATLTTFGDPSVYPKPSVSGPRKVCAVAAATLAATGPGGSTFRWYAGASSQTPLFEGAVFTTPALSASTSYFVATVLCGGEGPRQEIFVVASTPVVLTGAGPVASPASICSGTSLLSAESDAANGQVVYWYDAPTGGNLLGITESGDSLPVQPTVTTTYYAETGPRKTTVPFQYNGSGQTFTVPAGVNELLVEAYGARGGGGTGGGGGLVRAVLAVNPGQGLGIYVGQQGIAPNYTNTSAPSAFNGGGGGAAFQKSGGGATDIRSTPAGGLYDRVLVAGGGGGGYSKYSASATITYFGGGGGGLVGGTAYSPWFPYPGSTGGSQTAGGHAFGLFGQGATGGYRTPNGDGFRGGGGGGWYGGGGGGEYGGGGGSSYTDPFLCTEVTHAQGVWGGNGQLTITYTPFSTCVAEPRRPVTVTVRHHPTVTLTPSQYSCPGSPVTLTASGADNFQWQPGSLMGASIVVAPTANTTYTVVGTDNNSNCGDTAYSTITNTFRGTTADTVCAGGTTSVALNDVPPGATVNWYTAPAGSGSLAGTGNAISPVGAGTYYARFELPCGFVDAAPVTVFNSAQVPVTISGDTLLCPGTNTFLSAAAFGSISWGVRPLPVDAAPAPARVAVGLRLLNSTYTGPLVRLRRSTDDAKKNFGALGNALDTGAIRTWLAGGTAFCVTLFDQSGSGNHITQDTGYAQAELVMQNAFSGRPVLRFNTEQFMQLDAAFAQPYTISVTARQWGAARQRVLASVRNNWLLGWHGGFQGRAFFEGWVAGNGSEANSSFQVYTGTSDGVTGSLYENGSLLAANGSGVAGPDGLQLNGWGGSEHSDCEIAELLVFGAVLQPEARTVVESGAHNYYAAPDRLLVMAPEFGHPITYTATAVSAGCGTSRTASITVRSAASGDPADFGSGAWNVSVWQKGGPFDAAWSTGYAGFYIDSSLALATASRWAAASSPSSATGYADCAVPTTGHSWSAKRKGFPCAWYRIDVTAHDAGQLWVNGSKVWEHDGCCDGHGGVWTGSLGAGDSVEFRATRDGSQSASSLTFTPIAATVSYNLNWLCVSGSRTATVSIPGGTFSASPGGLLIDPASGMVTGGTPGHYVVTYTVDAGCAGLVTDTASFDVEVPQGDPSVFGAGLWNVYAWNSGGATIPNSNSWNLNYTGFLVAPGLNFNTADYWTSTGTPSGAAGFSGCDVNAGQFSWSAKRKGFPCDRYQINIPTHRYTGQLWINGVMIWEHRNSGDYHSNVWTGFLGPMDSVEFRCLQSGSGFGSIAFIPLGYSVDLSYQVTNSCTGSVPVAAAINYSGGVFSSLPAGLALDTATGTIIPASSNVGNYTIYYAWVSPCGDTLVDSSQLSIGSQQGDPSVFGADEWRVYVWNNGGASIAPNSWSTNYSGYYTATGTDFSTLNQWADNVPPSSAPGYVGCPVGTENHSWSAKRKGFPCGYYSINVDSHDDAAQLWINGVLVWEHNACCDAHTNAWEGMLGATDSVEFRVTQGVGGANGTLSFDLSVSTFSYTSSPYCTSAGLVSPSRQLTGGIFSASPAGLAIDPATGKVNTASSLGGIYTVSYTFITNCGDTLVGTAPITITAPGGDPTVPGTNAWNVYAWNAGDHANQQQSWNTDYVGYIPNVTTNQSIGIFYINGANPSTNITFQGCPITSTRFSWSAIRKGFTCGRYALRITVLDVSGELWINGDLIRNFDRYEASNAIVWQGYLSSADTVEMRVRSYSGYGSRMTLTLTAIAQTASLAYPASTGCYVAGTTETILAATTGITTGNFAATPAGLSLNSTTGAIDLATSSAGSYTVTYIGTSICGTVLSTTSAVTVVSVSGNPSVYGSNQWNVYAWNAGNESGTPWTTAYAGYYVESSLSFNTTARWDGNNSPSSASGYQGCPVGNDNHSWSAKRKGFPCGYYTLDVPGHDDNVELRINGVLVFSHTDCCDTHSAVWEGVLGPDDKIEFRVSEGVGGSMGELSLTLHPTITASTWTGALDRDWTNSGNWCGSVPTFTTDVVIPATAISQPIVYGGDAAMVRNLTVQSGTSLTVQGTLNLYGNLMNTGGSLDMSSGTLDLEGSSLQTVAAFTVQTLNVNGGGGFNLSNNSTISNALNFGVLGGRIILGNYHLTTGLINGGGTDAFIVTNGTGTLKRKTLSGTQLMPVGVSELSYTPLQITSTEGLDWSVRVQPDFSGYPAISAGQVLSRIWHITPSQTPTIQGADLVFFYPTTLWATPFSINVYHYDVSGGSWGMTGANGTGLTTFLSNGYRSVAVAGQQQFSPFALGGSGSVLPVSLLDFSGMQVGSINELAWHTASETNNRGFIVQRSEDGRLFIDIGFVSSRVIGGTSNTILTYNFRDSSFSGLRHQYRLRQVDFDGRSKYSPVISIQRAMAAVQLVVFPNPASTELFVRLKNSSEPKITIIVNDVRGRTVYIKAGLSTGGDNRIELHNLAAGSYSIKVLDGMGGLIGTSMFIKK